MPGPWEKYQSASAGAPAPDEGPWTRYRQSGQPTQPGSDDELDQISQQVSQPWAKAAPTPSLKDNAIQAGKGLAQTAVNIANIPSSIGDAVYDADAWLASKLQGKTVQPSRMPRFELPESMKPTDEYAQLGAEIGPYLIPGVGAERTAVAPGSVANAGRVERLATKAADMLAENLPGALAQNSGNNQQGLAKDLALGAVGSGVARAAGPVLSKAAGMFKRGSGAAEQEAAAVVGSPASSGVSPVSDEQAIRYAQAAQSGKEGRIADVVNDIQPDQNVIEAMHRLDIKPDDMLEAYTSGNDSFKALQIGLASQDESALAAVKRENLLNISKRAAKIIDDAGAMPDRLAMDDSFKSQFNTARNTLKSQENALYQPIHNAIPAKAEIDPANTRNYLDSLADELGGYQFLSPVEKKVYEAVSPTSDKAGAPTYARLNAMRGVVGSELSKAGTPFGSAEERNLSQLYSQLSNDRDAVAKAAGFGEQVKLANAITAQRKMMEKNVYDLLGKDLSGDVTVKAKSALDGLQAGNTKSFNQLMRTVPDKATRSQLIATGLRDIFRKGARTEAENNINGFVKFYADLKRNGSIRLLQKELPATTAREMEDFYTVARNVTSANRYHLQTGKINAFLEKFDKQGGFLDKLAQHSKAATIAAVLSPVPVVGHVAASAAGAHIAAMEATKESGSAAVTKLMTSPTWKKLTYAGRLNPGAEAQEKLVEQAEKELKLQPAWREFYRTLPAEEKANIARVGIIGWLSGEADDSQ